MGRISNAEKARRAEEKAKREAEWAEWEAKQEAMKERNKPYVEGICNILDNIDLGDYSGKWGSGWSRPEVMNDKRISIHYATFGGSYPDDHFYDILVGYNHNTKQFESTVRQCRMGDLKPADLERVISETNRIKPMLEAIKVATDKVMDYAKVNGLELY